MKKQLLLFVMMLLPMVASAYDFELDGFYYNVISVSDWSPSCWIWIVFPDSSLQPA